MAHTSMKVKILSSRVNKYQQGSIIEMDGSETFRGLRAMISQGEAEIVKEEVIKPIKTKKK
jgi:hypothetical protein